MYLSELFKRKKIVYILSTMRSGSTLLKSLLANEKSVSHLPEVHFHKYQGLRRPLLKTLSKSEHLVLKKPSWIGEGTYPRIPIKGKNLVLIRHPYEVVLSILKMEMKLTDTSKHHSLAEILSYWNQTYSLLHPMVSQSNGLCVQYERITKDPIIETKKIFSFMEIDSPGYDSYSAPEDYDWAWFNDDGGENIKSLKVQNKLRERSNDELIDLIANNTETQRILQMYDYKQKD